MLLALFLGLTHLSAIVRGKSLGTKLTSSYMKEYLLHLQVHLNHTLIGNSALRSFKCSNVIVIHLGSTQNCHM